jgi:hypothetical protein
MAKSPNKKRTSSSKAATLQPKEVRAKKPKQESAGRPTIYTEEIGDLICARLAEGESLNAICAGENLPAESTVRSWAVNPEHPISAKYRAAREVGYMKMADELLEISDDGSNDWMERRHGDDKESTWVVNGEHVQRSKLRVETRKWILSKALPKVYGDKVAVTGEGGAPLIPETPTRDLARAIIEVLREAKVDGDDRPA